MSYPSVSRGHPGYPPLLAELHDPPRRLYLRGGSAQVLSLAAVAVVGARSCSPYGAQVARDLARELTAAGIVIVSGLARGIDGEAHRGALAAGGLTVAVLGCGIDRDYPRAHAELAQRVAESGLVVSEYPPGVEPSPWRFPARNRRRLEAMPFSLNHAGRPCRIGRQIASWCGPGVVSEIHRSAGLRIGKPSGC
jgi:DNA processing protein